jgi:hypothetical protein
MNQLTIVNVSGPVRGKGYRPVSVSWVDAKGDWWATWGFVSKQASKKDAKWLVEVCAENAYRRMTSEGWAEAA